ncbi:2OG-Fe(II) oxygenase [Rheinheimera sp. WS51]|uniref:2OG-Fe(II) oxygenase n=1 Tax=Rheinheimera sp. WS51 TaxID=3425886 RepID=UPI003D8E6DF5
MWLNKDQITPSALRSYRKALLHASPNHVVIDNLFDNQKLDTVISVLQQEAHWQSQKHTYEALYVDNTKWLQTQQEDRFVKRDYWQPKANNTDDTTTIALDFLTYLRSNEFMALLSRIFKVSLTDINVANPAINTNYFRLAATDFVKLHADDSPGREVCMLLYLNKNWSNCANNSSDNSKGGELIFKGTNNTPIRIAPLYNRCVLFDPSSTGSEHWVNPVTTGSKQQYRYNITSWYWSE